MVTLISVSQNYHFISRRSADANNTPFLILVYQWKLAILHKASLRNRCTHLLCLVCPFFVAHQKQIYWQIVFI